MQREFIFTDKWLDLMFEHRNRTYGAYVLRKRQPDNVLIGLSVAVLFMGSVVFAGWELNKLTMATAAKIPPIMDGIIKFSREIIIPGAQPVIEIEKKATPPKTAPSANTVQIVKDAVVNTDTEVKKEEISASSVSTNNNDNTNVSSETTTNGNPNTDVNTTSEFKSYEKMPEFPGGESALLNYLAKNTAYPPLLINENVSGTVYVSFVVDADGSIGNIKILHGIEGYPEFAEAAIKSIIKMPKWIPGMQNGINVPVQFTVPVKFSVRKGF